MLDKRCVVHIVQKRLNRLFDGLRFLTASPPGEAGGVSVSAALMSSVPGVRPTCVGTGPADQAAAGPVILQTIIFMFTLYQLL